MPDSDLPISLFRLGENCCAVAGAARAAVLVDGAAYFDAFARAAEQARASITILAWDFDSRTPLAFGDGCSAAVLLGDFLNRLVRRRRRLRVRVLDWDYPMIFGHDREFPPRYGMGWKPHRRVRFRYDGSHPLAGSHHQKIVAIDDKLAFVGGFDLTRKRWDTPEHRAEDSRRAANGQSYPPFHDLMIALDGEAARAVSDIARKRWCTATGERLAPIEVPGDPWPASLAPDFTDLTVGIACTAPPIDGAKPVRHVEQLYLDMIARAQRYIYLENQYFTSQKIGDALRARLGEPRGPEIVLVTRLLSHGWLEEVTMHVLRTRLVRELLAADRNGRFHVYYPHVVELAEGTCIDVHSKMMAVDDAWLRIGSANLSNRSMGLDTECDVVVEAGGEERIRQAIRGFRDRLLAEHLGVPVKSIARAIERAGTMSGAIATLGSAERTLRPLDDLPEWSDAAMTAAAIADPERPVSLENLVEQFAPDIEVHRAVPIWRTILAAAAVVIGLAIAWRYTSLAELVSGDTVIAWVHAFAGRWWAPLVIVLAYTPASVIMFPRPLITLAAVIAFGPWLGFVYAMGGVLVAAVTGYGAGRMLDRDTVRRMVGGRVDRLTHALKQRGILAITAIRLVPGVPFAVGSLVAGAIRIRLWHLLAGTFLGMLPGLLAATVLGRQLEAAFQHPGRANYWVIAGAVAALIVTFVVVTRFVRSGTDGRAAQPAAPSSPRSEYRG